MEKLKLLNLNQLTMKNINQGLDETLQTSFANYNPLDMMRLLGTTTQFLEGVIKKDIVDSPISETSFGKMEPKELTPMVAYAIPEKEILYQRILDEVEEIDFKEILELSKSEKVSQDDYRVASVENFVSIANTIGYPIEIVKGELSMYNGVYWQATSNGDLRSLLGEVALKSGVPKAKAKLDKFKHGLYSQLYEEVLNFRDDSVNGININLANSVLSVANNHFEFNDFSPKYYLTYQLPYFYDENAECKKFMNFLDMVVPDKNIQNILAEVIASAFLPTANLEKFPVLLGKGGNGKGVFFNIILALLGKENISNFSISTLTKEDSNERIKLSQSLLNYDSDMSGMINDEYFKKMVSLEPITARALYKDPITLYKYARIMGNTNSLPQNIDLNDANIRRLMPIPFNVTISDKQKDPELANKIIKDELPGILNWVLKGLMRLLKQKRFTQSKAIDKTLEIYLQRRNPIQAFLYSNGYKICTEKSMSLIELHKEFITYCKTNDFKISTDKELASMLRKLGYKETARNGCTHFFTEKS